MRFPGISKIFTAAILFRLAVATASAHDIATDPTRYESATDTAKIAWVQSECLAMDSAATHKCEDSLNFAFEAQTTYMTLYAAEVRAERDAFYFLDFMPDLFTGNHVTTIGNSKDWTLVLFAAAGILVIGATVIYLPKLGYDLAVNEDDLPIYREATLHYGYSGSSWNAGGPPVSRTAQIGSGRFTLGARRDYLGIGITGEGGVLDVRLKNLIDQPGREFYRTAAFGLVGPSLQIGSDRLFGGVDFLNGVDFLDGAGHPAWMSESRFSFDGLIGKRLLLGVYVGALFYDLKFFDGLVWREGAFNRDLSLIGGLESGVAF